MTDMELVIKISEEDFERCKKRFQMRIDIIGDAIANGIPLPKGHGALKDTDAILDKIRAEIERKIKRRPWLDFEDRERDRNDAFLEALDIIDKYKVEREV